MPFHLNQVNVAGTMTRDPEVKFTPKGTAVVEVGLAINRTWKDDSNAKHEETLFLDCEGWGRTAEVIGEYCRKGHTIFIEGRMRQDTWEDKQTKQKRSKIKVVIEKFHFVSKPQSEYNQEGRGGEEDESQEYAPAPQQQRQQARQQRPASPPRRPAPAIDPDLDTPEEDDIPF